MSAEALWRRVIELRELDRRLAGMQRELLPAEICAQIDVLRRSVAEALGVASKALDAAEEVEAGLSYCVGSGERVDGCGCGECVEVMR